jgi:hypothetical protein
MALVHQIQQLARRRDPDIDARRRASAWGFWPTPPKITVWRNDR